MLRLLPALALLPLLTGCLATSGDLQEVTDAWARFEEKAADEYAPKGEVEEAFGEVGETLGEVVDRVEARGQAWFESAEGLGGGGVLGLLTAVGLNMYRNSQRRKRGEPVTAGEAARQGPAA